MGDIVRFRKPPRNRGQFRGQGGWKPGTPNPKRPKRPRRNGGGMFALSVSLLGLLALAGAWWGADRALAGDTFACEAVSVIDGDTFECGSRTIRMTGIDAPEMPGHCRPGRECTPGDPYASTENLRRLLAAGPVECRETDTDAYGRTVARCTAGGLDLSCKQVEGGFAVRRYATIQC